MVTKPTDVWSIRMSWTRVDSRDPGRFDTMVKSLKWPFRRFVVCMSRSVKLSCHCQVSFRKQCESVDRMMQSYRYHCFFGARTWPPETLFIGLIYYTGRPESSVVKRMSKFWFTTRRASFPLLKGNAWLICFADSRGKSGGPTWSKPPRDVVDKIEKLLESGKSDVAIRNHYTLVDYQLTEQHVRRS